jgi:hypothetical protein
MDLDDVWQRLTGVRALEFRARSTATTATGWQGVGQGTVEVQAPSEETLVYREQGQWKSAAGTSFAFTNSYRWTRYSSSGLLSLEHLRFGDERPVSLFELAAAGEGEWRSTAAHVCSEDCYSAVMTFGDGFVHLEWNVSGPNKSEVISYLYREVC